MQPSTDMQHLLGDLKIEEEDDGQKIINLKDFNHLDYVEDLLAEHFDLSYDYKVVDDDSGTYRLFFTDLSVANQLEMAIRSINEHHSIEGSLYQTIGS